MYPQELILNLGKRNGPLSTHYGYKLVLDTSESNFLVPSKYQDKSLSDQGNDIALIKIPEAKQQEVLNFVYQSEEEPKYNEQAI